MAVHKLDSRVEEWSPSFIHMKTQSKVLAFSSHAKSLVVYCVHFMLVRARGLPLQFNLVNDIGIWRSQFILVADKEYLAMHSLYP